ncbi:hypothetical protein C8R43DRAFT_514042 [Mycena crocata]|nr:hypothetical protein C8R43DRAFT_514042 [Mycena crocata]
MRQATFVSLGLALVAQYCTHAAQIPLQIGADSWDLTLLPSLNATHNLIFDTVSSLLQHWPNTRYRNGHSVVPGTVPIGSLLYHGRSDANLPTGPDWTATDPEHSYIFCRGKSDTGCWHLTLIASRPLQVLYFDGSSAAKMRDGPMDTQDVVGWGEILPDRFFDERRRILDLCNWGKPLGIDGYVRMEMDFEIMLCDFKVGVEVVSMANLASQGRGGPGGPPRRNLSDDAQGPVDTNSFEVILSGSWHNRYPGDRRIKLDLTRLISFYDTALVPSLVAKRLNLERWDHRLLGLSSDDIASVMARLAEAYTAPPQVGSGVDWDVLFKVVVDRYDERLEILRYVLNSTTGDALALTTTKKAMVQLRGMLTPYIPHTAVPKGTSSAWAAPVYKLCATSHTEYIRRSTSLSAKLTASEQLLLRAVEGTNREICRVVVGMWAEGAAAGLDETLPVLVPADATALVRKWKGRVDDLMAWLDWSVWVKCRPACGFEEICYLPTWPFAGGGGDGPPVSHIRPEDHSRIRDNLPATLAEDYLRPQPRCVRRLEPYTF